MIEWNAAGLKSLIAEDPTAPLVMLNLLRFRPDGGLKMYLEYISQTNFVRDDYGAEIIYWGLGREALVGESGQQWDQVALVSYPTRQTFVDMVSDPRFQALEHLRTGALLESVLQPTTPTQNGS
jgi:uncharacterized protein (DUF1330 family)